MTPVQPGVPRRRPFSAVISHVRELTSCTQRPAHRFARLLKSSCTAVPPIGQILPWGARPVSVTSRSPPASQNGRQQHHLPRQLEPRWPFGLRLPARTGTLWASSPARALAALRRVELFDQDVQPGQRALLPALRPENARSGHHQVRCPPPSPQRNCASARHHPKTHLSVPRSATAAERPHFPRTC